VDIIHLTHRRKKKENKRNSPSLVSAWNVSELQKCVPCTNLLLQDT
jgi:hypothetical protein